MPRSRWLSTAWWRTGYVIRHRNHSDALWSRVNEVLLDYRDRKEWVGMRGAELETDKVDRIVKSANIKFE